MQIKDFKVLKFLKSTGNALGKFIKREIQRSQAESKNQKLIWYCENWMISFSTKPTDILNDDIG